MPDIKPDCKIDELFTQDEKLYAFIVLDNGVKHVVELTPVARTLQSKIVQLHRLMGKRFHDPDFRVCDTCSGLVEVLGDRSTCLVCAPIPKDDPLEPGEVACPRCGEPCSAEAAEAGGRCPDCASLIGGA